MKRWTFRIVLCLLLATPGAVTTVAVAWGLAAWSDSYGGNTRFIPAVVAQYRHTQDSEPELPEWVDKLGWSAHAGWRAVSTTPFSSFGVQQVAVFELPVDGLEWTGPMVPFAIRTQAGWPANSLSGAIWYPGVDRSRPGGTALFVDAFPFEVNTIQFPGPGASDFYLPEKRAVPLRPIWPGFVINTLFYAVIWFGLFFGIGAARRAIRRRRGRCVKCGYDLRGTPDDVEGCSECGWGRCVEANP